MYRTLLQDALQLTCLTLVFGRVERVTRHEDGIRPETDTDHTVMLGIMACAFAAKYEPTLDRGLIAQFALVHDLVEAYAGDTVTSHILSPDEQELKAMREAQAFRIIKADTADSLPWVSEAISEYDSLRSPEARYVKAFDKILPKLTHILNECAVLADGAGDLYHTRQRQQMVDWVGEMPWLINLWEQSVARVLAIAYAKKSGDRPGGKE